MPWYRTGTVAITAGQTTVTGTGTNFSANARVGDAFQGPDGRWYEVTNITSATVLSILPSYQGATVTAGAYGLAPMQGYVKESADRLRQLVDQFGSVIAGLGSVSTENVVPVAKGGTGATTAAGARAALGAMSDGAYGLGGNSTLQNVDPEWLGNRFYGWNSAVPSSPGGTNAAGLDMGYAVNRRMQIGISTSNRLFYRYTDTPNGQTNWSQAFGESNADSLPLAATLSPISDNNRQLGRSVARWSVVFAGTGTINTSDAREKTPVRSLSSSEIQAARALADEIGVYQWLASVQEKGESDARQHVGMTVQRAIEILKQHELDPFAYGFVCYDTWEEQVEVIPAVYEEIVTDEGVAIQGALIAPERRNVLAPAGDRYSFRTDQLNTFIAAGLRAENAELRARQDALEVRLAALESA